MGDDFSLNCYDRLGVKSTSTSKEIKDARDKIVKRLNAQGADSDDRLFAGIFQEVQECWEILSDGARRRDYDASLLARKTNRRSRTETNESSSANTQQSGEQGSEPSAD